MTNEELEAIRAIIRAELAPIKEDLEAVKEDTEITRGAVNALVEWADNVAVVTGQRFPVKRAE